jgi:two-component system, NtrC family, response regulator AtoC
MPDQKQFRALLAVRDERASCALRGYFRARGEIVEANPESDLSAAVRTARPSMILLEIQGDGRRLESLRRAHPAISLIALAQPLPELAFLAAKLGAVAFLPLPLDAQELAARLDPLITPLIDAPSTSAPRSNGGTPAPERPEIAAPAEPLDRPTLFNASPRMTEIRKTIEKVANTNATVLIRGESGVGKELAARLIFTLSGRRDKPFVKLNCAAIPHDLLESELFGYEAGAFTGAVRSKPGKFELAHGGTLFLDEIGEMHPALQAKLLHVLQDGEYARLGAKQDISVNVRVVCATNKQLEQLVTQGLFREDLFYRINVVTVNIPPLRERREEIAALSRYFLAKYAALYERPALPLSHEVLQSLMRYAWPGNIRELENLCKRFVIFGDASQMVRELAAKPYPSASAPIVELRNADAPETAAPSLLEIGRQAAWTAERQAIESMLVETRWNRREAARRLRVSYKALLNKIKQIEQDRIAS